VVVGLKVTVKVLDAPELKLYEEGNTLKLAHASVTLPLSAPPPVLVIVKVLDELDPTVTVPKPKLVGDTEQDGGMPPPVPETNTFPQGLLV
jgi:hypothetical protein